MKIVLDCDDVMLDWIGGFKKFINKKGIYPKLKTPTCFDLNKWLGRTDGYQLVEEFNASDDFNQLYPLPGAVESVMRLAKEHLIVVVTSCGVNPITVKAREFNINVYFPGLIHSVICLPLGHSKVATIKAHSADWFVDDNLNNVLDSPCQAILFDKPHNRSHDKVLKAYHWTDIVNHILPIQKRA